MAGESAREKAQQARERAQKLLADAEKWERGADGESRTAEVLACLGPEWIVGHDLTWPGRRYANIDHVVIGPTGIFVIDSKNWSGSISVRDGVLRQNGSRREKEVAACGESAIAVGRLVPDFMKVCQPLMCFVHNGPINQTARDVSLCSTETLIATITARPIVLNGSQVSRIAKTLGTHMAARSTSPKRTPQLSSSGGRRSRPARRGRRSPARRVLHVLVSVFFAWIAIGLVLMLGQTLIANMPQPAPTVAGETPGHPAPSAGRP